MHDDAAVHIIRMEHGKANAIDAVLLQTIEEELDRALANDCRSVVLTGFGRFFSAGLNLESLPEDRAAMAPFVDHFESFFMKLLRFPLPVVAAVNGHAIAGGCVLACAADLRLGAEGTYHLGVSEVSLGIVFPACAFEIMRAALVPTVAPDVLLDGRLVSPDEAVSAGMLHALHPADALLERAVARAAELGDKPQDAFRHTKLALRAPMLERIERTAVESREGFLRTWSSPDVIARRKAMLAK